MCPVLASADESDGPTANSAGGPWSRWWIEGACWLAF